MGPFPTSLYASITVSSLGSTRATPAGATATHTPSGVKATPEGRPARKVDSCSARRRIESDQLGGDGVGRSRVRYLPPRCPGSRADRELVSHITGPRVDPHDRAVTRVRHPHRALPDRDAGRRSADLDVRMGDRAVLEAHARHDSLNPAWPPTDSRIRSRSRRDVAPTPSGRARGSRSHRSSE